MEIKKAKYWSIFLLATALALAIVDGAMIARSPVRAALGLVGVLVLIARAVFLYRKARA